MKFRSLAPLLTLAAIAVVCSTTLMGSAQAGGPGSAFPGYHGGLGVPQGARGPGWNRPGRLEPFGKPWRRPFARGFYNQPFAGFWGNPDQATNTTVYTVPETQRFEIAPELPVAVGGYRPAPVGAPVVYVIDTPQGRPNARVLGVGSVKALGAPIIGSDGDQTPHIVELIAR